MIKIGSREEKDYMILFVEDNGIGMREERLLQIRSMMLPEAKRRNDSYGIYNVNERLRLRFGSEYHLEINSTYGKGTFVEIYLPKAGKKEMEI